MDTSQNRACIAGSADFGRVWLEAMRGACRELAPQDAELDRVSLKKYTMSRRGTSESKELAPRGTPGSITCRSGRCTMSRRGAPEA